MQQYFNGNTEKWLITGINGLLGQTMVHHMVNQININLFGLSRGRSRLKAQNVTYYESTMASTEELTNIVCQIEPDVVFHLAAMTNVDTCEMKKEEAKHYNVDATAFLVKACEQLPKFPHIIYLSTDFVFDGKQKVPYVESDKKHPLNHYGYTKSVAEDIIAEKASRYAIVRTSLVYGYPYYSGRKDIVRWIAQELQQAKSIHVVIDQYRNPTYTVDLAHALIALAHHKSPGIYHIAGAEPFSLYDLGLQIASFLGIEGKGIVPVSTSTLNQQAIRPQTTYLNTAKARKQIGYISTPFYKTIALTLQDIAHQNNN